MCTFLKCQSTIISLTYNTLQVGVKCLPGLFTHERIMVKKGAGDTKIIMPKKMKKRNESHHTKKS